MVSIFFRVGREASSDENNLNCLAVSLHESNQVDSCLLNSEAEIEERKSDSIEFEDTENDEEETPKYFLNFKFQSLEEFCKSNHENWDLVPSTSTNKYEFKSENYLSGFIEEPRDVSFSVKELYADSMNVSSGIQEVMADEFLLESDFMDQNLGEGTVDEEGEVAEKLELATLIEDEKQKPKDEEGLGDVVFLSENDLVASDSDADSITSSNELSVLSPYIGSTSDGFLSDKDFEEEFEFSIMRSIERDLEDLHLQKFSDDAAEDADDEDSDIMEELKQLEESDDVENSSTQGSEMLSGKDFHDENDSKNHEFSGKKNQATSSLNEANNSNLQNSSASVDSEDSNGLETLWEHQDLIEQLKMELKKVRAIGLPTILEESESPKIMEDLKPWKIDEKFQHEDRMGELHKFYRSYRERMRKFDILNYQKMYAIGQLLLAQSLTIVQKLYFCIRSCSLTV